MTEDEMIGWHHQLNGHEFEQTPGDSEGWEAWNVAVHGVTKSPKELDTTEQLKTTTSMCNPKRVTLWNRLELLITWTREC